MSETIDCRGKDHPTMELRLLQETDDVCPHCVDVRLSGDLYYTAIEVLDGDDKAVSSVIVSIEDSGHAVILVYDAKDTVLGKFVVPKLPPGTTDD